MNHKHLCEIAVKWLKRPNSNGGPGCAVALSECRSGWSGEIPDAIGFRASGHWDGSYVVEVKTSRADFLADAKKPHRASGGMGNWRYFMAPAGLIKTHELPEGWGLLEVNSRGHVKALSGAAASYKGPWGEMEKEVIAWRQEADTQREQFLLVRAMANTGDPQKVLDMIREANNRASRAIAAYEQERKRADQMANRWSEQAMARALA